MADFGSIGVSTFFSRGITATPPAVTINRINEFIRAFSQSLGLSSVRLFGGTGGVFQSSTGALVIQGIVRENSAPVARQVFALRRSDGLLVGQAISSAEDGTFVIHTDFADEVFVVALDDKDTPPEFNALIYDSVLAQ